MTTIGILGSGGAVGSAAARRLLVDAGGGGFDLILGMHHAVRRPPVGARDTVVVNAYNDDELSAFVGRCDVVLNLVGPAGRSRQRVLGAAAVGGARYVDAGGARLLDRFAGREITIPAILDAGLNPGLTGVVLRQTIRRLQPGGQARIWSGGLGELSRSAAADYLTVADPAVGTAFVAFVAGHHQPLLDPDRWPPPPATDRRVEVRPYLSAELARVARAHQIERLEAYSVFDGLRLIAALSLTSSQRSAEGLVSAAAADVAGEDPYQLVVAESLGIIETVGMVSRVIVRGGDAAALAGSVAAYAAQLILDQRTEPGIRYAALAIDPEPLARYLKQCGVAEWQSATQETDLADLGSMPTFDQFDTAIDEGTL